MSYSCRYMSEEPTSKRRLPWRVVLLGVFLLASMCASAYLFMEGHITRELVQETVRDAGAWGMLVFIVGVVVIELLWIPRAWGLLAGGALFGPLVGALLSIVADLIGALLCYLIARGGGRKWVEGLLLKRPKASRVIELLAERRGGFIVGALRMMPIAHYTLVSYAAGLTGVKLHHYMIGTAVGLIPYAVVYPLVGDAALEPSSPTFIIGIALVVVGFVVSAWYARRFLKKNG